MLQPTRAVWALRVHTLARLDTAPDRLALIGVWGPAGTYNILLSNMRVTSVVDLPTKVHVTICEIHLVVCVTEGAGDGVGMAVLGLRLCGAVLREGALCAAPAHAPPHAPAPPLHLRFVPQVSQDQVTPTTNFSVKIKENRLTSVIPRVWQTSAQISRSSDS